MFDNYHAVMATLKREAPVLAQAMIVHRSKRGHPMTFGTMPYLAPLYERLPNLDGADIISGVQTGKSELFLTLMLYLSGWKGRTCAYVQPTFGVRSRFVKTRIDPLLAQVPEYRQRLPGGDPTLAPRGHKTKGSQALKPFGAGMMMFMGSNTETDFIEFSADAMFVDEFDQCDPTNLAKGRDRLRMSRHPQLFRLGNPTLPRIGIDTVYRKSDQRRWYYRCPHCNEAQPLDWFVNFVERLDDGRWMPRDRSRMPLRGKPGIEFSADGSFRPVQGDLRPQCRKCHKFFDRATAWWTWVAENPGLDLREGYRMSRLDVLHQSIWELFEEWIEAQGNTALIAAFFTSVLGMAYEKAGARLTVEDLVLACEHGAPNDYTGGDSYADELVVMGVDVGNLLNVNIDVLQIDMDDETQKITTTRKGAWVGTCSRFEELDDLIRRFHVATVVVDAQPETRKAQELRDRWLGNGCDVWLCRFYPTPRAGVQRFGLKVDWNARIVQVDRTQTMDAAFDDIRERRRIFPSDAMTVLGFSDQMRAPVRVLNEEKQRIVWTEGSAADHYRLSDLYALVASEMANFGGTYITVGG